MPLLLLLFVVLILILTGAIIPALIAGGWLLVVILGVALLLGLAAAVLRPVIGLFVGAAELGREARRRRSLPGDGDMVAARQRPADSGPEYLAWANREGEYADSFAARRPAIQARRGYLVKKREAWRRRVLGREVAALPKGHGNVAPRALYYSGSRQRSPRRWLGPSVWTSAGSRASFIAEHSIR